MTIVGVKNENYKIELEIGDVTTDPYPINIYINYLEESKLLDDLYIQFEEDRSGESRLLSLDVSLSKGLIKMISLISCKTLLQEDFLYQKVSDKKYGIPILGFQNNDKIISSGELDADKQLFISKKIDCVLDKDLFWIWLGERELAREIIASDKISFYSDKEQELSALSIRLEESDKDILMLWF